VSARDIPPSSRPPRSVADATERLAAIVEAAEQAASKVIDDAEEEARRRLEEAREKADMAVAERLRELADELDPEGAQPQPLPRLQAVDGGEAPPPRRSGSAGARLLATQMAVSGASREEIERRLRSGFEIDDTGEILDAILGPEE
jgi:hypothetical protein